jgi:hypothetical protein
MNPEKLLAGLSLVVCAVMLLRLTLRAPRRAARAAAQDAIRRAQTKPNGQWKGNVYTPDSFGSERKPPSKRDLH